MASSLVAMASNLVACRASQSFTLHFTGFDGDGFRKRDESVRWWQVILSHEENGFLFVSILFHCLSEKASPWVPSPVDPSYHYIRNQLFPGLWNHRLYQLKAKKGAPGRPGHLFECSSFMAPPWHSLLTPSAKVDVPGYLLNRLSDTVDRWRIDPQASSPRWWNSVMQVRKRRVDDVGWFGLFAGFRRYKPTINSSEMKENGFTFPSHIDTSKARLCRCFHRPVWTGGVGRFRGNPRGLPRWPPIDGHKTPPQWP